MWKFADERVTKIELTSNVFKQPIPIAIVKPKVETNDSCIFIFNTGLAGTIIGSLFMDSHGYDNNWFVTYEKAGHGENKNKPSQYKGKYIKELDVLVDWIKQQYPNRRIYLLGESWGSAINFLYLKKHNGKVDGVINWNMPTKPIDPEKKTFKQMYSIAWREIFTFLFNVTFFLPAVQKSHDKVSRNRILIRAMQFAPATRSNTKLTLAVWRFMKPSLRFLIKNINNPKYKFLYIQSAQDALADWNVIHKIIAKSDGTHFVKMETGYHILSMEPDEHKQFYDIILNFVNKK